VVNDVRELRDREAPADRAQRRHGRVDAALALHAVTLGARELDEGVRAGRDLRRDGRIRRRRGGRPERLRRDRLRALAVMAGGVGDHSDCDRDGDRGAEHRRQDPDLAPRAFLVGHGRILHSRPLAAIRT
jgi:hypothetical protein